jgi:hypothetical protein
VEIICSAYFSRSGLLRLCLCPIKKEKEIYRAGITSAPFSSKCKSYYDGICRLTLASCVIYFAKWVLTARMDNFPLNSRYIRWTSLIVIQEDASLSSRTCRNRGNRTVYSDAYDSEFARISDALISTTIDLIWRTRYIINCWCKGFRCKSSSKRDK